MRRTSLLLVLAGLTLTACGAPAANGQETPPDKVFVCKYVRKPGENGFELLQTGQNPISVSINALVGPGVEVNIGDEFQDAQGKSVVIAFDTGQPEPDVSECPGFVITTTTTIAPTTTTTGVTTSTSTSTSTTSIPTTTSSSTSTTTTLPSSTSTTSTSTPPGSSSTTVVPPTTLPQVFQFAGATTVCVVEVPTIRITFANTFPALAGNTGTLTMADINGNVVSTQALVYQPGTTVDLLYPGTSVNPDGTIDDVPGWILTDDGFWIRDDSDAFLREGINLTYTVNPTATAFVTYPPESSACANPDGPFPPGAPVPPPGAPPVLPPTDLPPTTGPPPGLPPTR